MFDSYPIGHLLAYMLWFVITIILNFTSAHTSSITENSLLVPGIFVMTSMVWCLMNKVTSVLDYPKVIWNFIFVSCIIGAVQAQQDCEMLRAISNLDHRYVHDHWHSLIWHYSHKKLVLIWFAKNLWILFSFNILFLFLDDTVSWCWLISVSLKARVWRASSDSKENVNTTCKIAVLDQEFGKFSKTYTIAPNRSTVSMI